MPPRVLLDATPLGGPHSRRGIGTYVRGLIDGFRQLEPEQRPTLLVRNDCPASELFVQYPIHMTEWGFRWYPDPRTRRRGEKRIAELRPRLVHATQTTLVPAGPALVATCHDLIPLRFPDMYLRGAQLGHRREYQTYLARLKRARLVITPSTSTASDLASLAGIPSERIRVVPHGVPEGVIPAVAGTDDPEAGCYVLYTQSLEPHKNVELAIEAIAHVRLPNVRLKLAGPWSRRRAARLQRLVQAHGVADRVDLLGYVSEAELNRLRASALALIVPSLIEGFGLPALEAMAAGVPVLGSDAPGLVEVTGPDLPALPRLDPLPWARAIERLATDPAERGRIAAMGLRRSERFRWVETARRTAEVYDEAMRV
ncbi:MAG: glycosyltransferase family 1 protein [Thermoleophilia bacterium]